MTEFLYHGTTEAALPSIMTHGIKPRGGGKKNNWRHTVGSNPKDVYLTVAYPLHFAMSAGGEKSNLALLEIAVSRLELWRMHADEDALEQVYRGHDELPESWDMKRRTMYYRRRNRMYGHEPSLGTLGTCGHFGTVPAPAITRVCNIPSGAVAELILRGQDPTISVMNYMILGARYRAFVAWMFGDCDEVPGLYCELPDRGELGITVMILNQTT